MALPWSFKNAQLFKTLNGSNASFLVDYYCIFIGVLKDLELRLQHLRAFRKKQRILHSCHSQRIKLRRAQRLNWADIQTSHHRLRCFSSCTKTKTGYLCVFSWIWVFWFSKRVFPHFLTLTLAVMLSGEYPAASMYSLFSFWACTPTRLLKLVFKWRLSSVFWGEMFNSMAIVSELNRGSNIYWRIKKK